MKTAINIPAKTPATVANKIKNRMNENPFALANGF